MCCFTVFWRGKKCGQILFDQIKYLAWKRLESKYATSLNPSVAISEVPFTCRRFLSINLKIFFSISKTFIPKLCCHPSQTVFQIQIAERNGKQFEQKLIKSNFIPQLTFFHLFLVNSMYLIYFIGENPWIHSI